MSCDHGYVDPSACASCSTDQVWRQTEALERIAAALETRTVAAAVVGPGDVLALITPEFLSSEQVADLCERLPAALRDRVLVMTGFADAKVLRGDAA